MMIQQQSITRQPVHHTTDLCPVQSPPGDPHEVRLSLKGRICHPFWTLRSKPRRQTLSLAALYPVEVGSLLAHIHLSGCEAHDCAAEFFIQLVKPPSTILGSSLG